MREFELVSTNPYLGYKNRITTELVVDQDFHKYSKIEWHENIVCRREDQSASQLYRKSRK